MREINIINKLQKAFAVTCICFLWVFIIPGAVAYFDNVFFQKQVEIRLPSRAKQTLVKYRKYQQIETRYKSNIQFLDSTINSQIVEKSNRKALDEIQLRNSLQNDLSKLRSPIYIAGFYNDRSLYYTFVSYFFLIITVAILLPYQLGRSSYMRIIKIALLIYVGWMFTNWLRSWLFFDEGRTVFSFANYDIDFGSFLLQELRILGISFLIAITWCSWSKYSEQVFKDCVFDSNVKEVNVISEYAITVVEMYKFWQINSVVVALAFLPWTFFYWGNVVGLKDPRYLITATVAHLYWAITWVIISVPVTIIYRRWLKAKISFISTSLDANLDFDKRMLFLDEINPLSTSQILGSIVVSIVSFLLPIVEPIVTRK